jgi:hypothetical protein
MVVDTVIWFHQVMGHPGEKRLREMFNQRIDKLKCKDCQKHKLAGCGYGLLPKQEVRIALWEEVAIDLTGLWKVKGCRKPPRYVPFKCTYVPYDGTFGTSDQGQTLDV